MTVVVVGAVNADLVLRGERIPLPGETRSLRTISEGQGGKGANQAAAAASLNADARLIGMIGQDDRGRAARADLAGRGVNVDGLGEAPGPTGLAVITVDDAGENSIGIIPGANALLTREHVVGQIRRIDGTEVVLVLSLEVPMDAVLAAAEEADRRNWAILLNPAPARRLPPELVRLCDVITPNAGEADQLGGAKGLLAAGAGAVVITRGGAGAALCVADGEREFAAFPARVVDTTGAGDAFTAGLATALANGDDLSDAIRVALACGAIATEAEGARGSLATQARVDRMLHSHGRGAPTASPDPGQAAARGYPGRSDVHACDR